MDRIKILVAGDIHLGRVSSRVSADELAEVSARGAWDRLIDLAVSEAVDLVCLTGDVADESNRFWEALGPLERGLRSLEAEGITTLAVSGNHDYDAMPRLADQLESESFRLLGRGGTWERYTYLRDGAALLHVDGWSFPHERVRKSPVESYEIPEDLSTPTLVMVHGDLNVTDSVYAPLSRERMLTKRVVGWLLGHIHAPRVDQAQGRPFILYPGSPQALDPGESGVHGAVIVEFEHGQRVDIRRVALSTVRYDHLDIDVSGVEDLTDLTSRVRDEVMTFASRAAREGEDRLKHLVLRLTLRGQTPIAAELGSEAQRIREDFKVEASGVRCSVDGVTLRVIPTIDLDALSRAGTPPGMLASVLLELSDDRPLDQLSDRVRALVDRVSGAVVSQRRMPVFSGVVSTEPRQDEVRELVREQAEALLIKLLQEQE